MKFLLLLLFIPFVYAQECQGCLFNDECIETGIQKLSGESALYCDKNNKMIEVKGIGELCSNNYECSTYVCDGFCTVREEKDSSFSLLFSLLISLIVFVLFFFRSSIFRKEAKKEKPRKKMAVYYKTAKVRRSYDPMEKKLKDLGKLK